jgi:hypothetical protein
MREVGAVCPSTATMYLNLRGKQAGPPEASAGRRCFVGIAPTGAAAAAAQPPGAVLACSHCAPAGQELPGAAGLLQASTQAARTAAQAGRQAAS